MILQRVNRKDCRKYIRFDYRIRGSISPEFVEKLAIFGEPEIQNFSKISSLSHDLFRIRNYEMGVEIAGSIGGENLSTTFKVKEPELFQYLESEITSLLNLTSP